MYKNQLQEVAQRSCFKLPSYTCLREGPDHAPRFKASVNFNGDTFHSPFFCSTLRQAEHSAAEVALNSLSNHYSLLAARFMDETGVYKNLLQEISQRVRAPLPSYTTFRYGLGHLPIFTCKVELAGITFTGEPAKNKKQAEKNAAMAAWSSLKQLARQASASTSNEAENNDEHEQMRIARALINYRLKEKMAMDSNANPFPNKFPMQLRPNKEPSSLLLQPPPSGGSKILPLILPKSTPPRLRHSFPAGGAPPYVPFQQVHGRMPSYHGMAPPVTVRTAVPVFSAPTLPPPHLHRNHHNHPARHNAGMGSPQQAVRIRQATSVFAAASPPVVMRTVISPTEAKEENSSPAMAGMPTEGKEEIAAEEWAAIELLKQLEIL